MVKIKIMLKLAEILLKLPGKFTHVAYFLLKIIKELIYCLTLVIIVSYFGPLSFMYRVQRLTSLGPSEVTMEVDT